MDKFKLHDYFYRGNLGITPDDLVNFPRKLLASDPQKRVKSTMVVDPKHYFHPNGNNNYETYEIKEDPGLEDKLKKYKKFKKEFRSYEK